MLQKLSHLQKAALVTADDKLGKAVDVLFERDTWTVRYLVVDTGPWLLGRKVPISTIAVSSVDWQHRKVETRLTRKQIKESPDIEPRKSIARPQEIELFTHYGWPAYWPAGGFTAVPPSDPFQFAQPPTESTEAQLAEPPEYSEEDHLQSVSEALDCDLLATDGKAGQLKDLLVDPETWQIKQLLVEATGEPETEHKHFRVLAVEQLPRPRWEEHHLRVDLPGESIHQAPFYDSSRT